MLSNMLHKQTTKRATQAAGATSCLRGWSRRSSLTLGIANPSTRYKITPRAGGDWRSDVEAIGGCMFRASKIRRPLTQLRERGITVGEGGGYRHLRAKHSMIYY